MSSSPSLHDSAPDDGRPIDVGDAVWRPQPGRLTLLAGSFAFGIALAWQFELVSAWVWLTVAATALLAAMLQRHRGALPMLCLCLAALACGSAWLNIKHFRIHRSDVASMASVKPAIVKLTGVVTRDPETREQSGGSLAAFDYRRPATYFPMDVDGVHDAAGRIIPARGAVYVRLDEAVPPFRAGDRVTVHGVLRAPSLPRNPGEFNFARYARSLGQAGVVTVPRRELLTIEPRPAGAVEGRLLAWRASVRQQATAALLRDLPVASDEQDALLSALLLGRRDPELDAINESFQRVGLAYLLAISGLHLAVVAAGVMVLARLLGAGERWRGVLLVVVALAYLVLVEVRMPVLRAAVMLMAAGAALSMGRQVRLSGAVALAATGLLIWRPDQLMDAGFQLSFGVVLGLALFAPVLRRRWFGRADRNPATVGQMLIEWLKNSLAAAVVAWLIATPIVAWHFGMLCPLAAPMSVIAIPLVSVLLLVGYVKMVLTVVLPSAALVVAAPLAIAAQTLLVMVTVIDRTPGSTLIVPQPSTAWALGMTVFAIAWIVRGFRQRGGGPWNWSLLASALILAVWLYWPWLHWRTNPDLRLDVLAVGDGSCYVLRSGGQTIVFDAGGQDLDLGDRVIVPALRQMNIRHVDAIIISHPNLDHYAAVLEVVDAFDCREVLVHKHFLDAAAADSTTSIAALMQGLAEHNVAIRTVEAGYERPMGDSTLTLLHPKADAVYEHVNDTSIVVQVEHAGRTILLAGDIQDDAIDALLARQPNLQVDVAELPHHGSHHDAAVRFIDRIDPAIVFQSCGWSRFSRDRWAAQLAGRERLVTARDGMCTVIVSDDGHIRTLRFLSEEDDNH